MKTNGQKGYAIVNIIIGVILVMASFTMFGDPSVGPGGFIAIVLGGVFWGIGAYALNTLKKHADDMERVKKVCRVNLICFIVSCVIMGACVILPIIAPLF